MHTPETQPAHPPAVHQHCRPLLGQLQGRVAPDAVSAACDEVHRGFAAAASTAAAAAAAAVGSRPAGHVQVAACTGSCGEASLTLGAIWGAWTQTQTQVGRVCFARCTEVKVIVTAGGMRRLLTAVGCCRVPARLSLPLQAYWSHLCRLLLLTQQSLYACRQSPALLILCLVPHLLLPAPAGTGVGTAKGVRHQQWARVVPGVHGCNT